MSREKNNLFLWQTAGFFFTSLMGTLLHFVYEWSGEKLIAAPFSAVNESTWEHMKILFLPMFIFSLIQKHLFGYEIKNYFCVKLKGIISGVILIPVLFYTINGAFGRTAPFVNIIIFYVSALSSYLYEWCLFKNGKKCYLSQTMCFAFLCVIFAVFVIFTFKAPVLPLFRDPLSGSFGL